MEPSGKKSNLKDLQGQKGNPGEQGIQVIQGPQGPVFGNDDTADMNVHSFKSDGGNIYSNGSGCLTIPKN